MSVARWMGVLASLVVAGCASPGPTWSGDEYALVPPGQPAPESIVPPNPVRTLVTAEPSESAVVVNPGPVVDPGPSAWEPPSPFSETSFASFQPFSSVIQDGTSNQEVDDLKARVAELEKKFMTGGEAPDASAAGSAEADSDLAGEDDSTGTDPRSFGTKFMPYYRYTKLKNDIYTNELVMFGLVRFEDSLAFTYEIPLAKNMDYSDLTEFKAGGGIPSNPGMGAPAGGAPLSDLDADGDNSGIGDLIVRAMYKNEALRFSSPFREGGSGEVIPILEATLPTASQDVLGGEALIASPGFAVVFDMPANGFIAAMNFYDIDVWHDNSRETTSRYRGRWFYMQPLTPPSFVAAEDPDIPDFGILAGIYLLPEIQPVYDFENDDFSIWIAPEIGKVISEGQILYFKPGWGIDQDRFDRQTTFEVGWRYFF